MHAVRVSEHGGIDAVEWAEIPAPVPGPGEVLVRIEAAGLNHLDLWVRRGVPGHRFPLPLTLGSDGAGVVEAVGPDVESCAPGDAVIVAPGLSCGECDACRSDADPLCRDYGILGESRDGTQAELVCVPARNIFRKPENVDYTAAGCFALVALTAWTMLVNRAGIRAGETVLVLAGGSGVGSLAVQIAKKHACRVIATAGDDEKCRRVADLGADEVIHHGNEDIARRVKELTDGRGVDIVVEHVGAATWQASLRSLAWGGRLVTCGATTGAAVECDLRPIFFKGISILGSTMGPLSVIPQLIECLADGSLAPVVAEAVPMREAARAHETLESRRAFGKVVLVKDS